MRDEDIAYMEQRIEIAPKKLLEFLLGEMKRYYNAGNSDCELAIADVILEGYLLDLWDLDDIEDKRLRKVVQLRLKKRLRGT